jgi:hypothetical protein
MKTERSFSNRYWFNTTRATVKRNVNRALSRKHNKYLKLIDKLSAKKISEGKAAAREENRPWTKRDELLARSVACVDLVRAVEAVERSP